MREGVKMDTNEAFPVLDPCDDDPHEASVEDLKKLGMVETTALMTTDGCFIWVLVDGKWTATSLPTWSRT